MGWGRKEYERALEALDGVSTLVSRVLAGGVFEVGDVEDYFEVLKYLRAGNESYTAKSGEVFLKRNGGINEFEVVQPLAVGGFTGFHGQAWNQLEEVLRLRLRGKLLGVRLRMQEKGDESCQVPGHTKGCKCRRLRKFEARLRASTEPDDLLTYVDKVEKGTMTP